MITERPWGYHNTIRSGNGYWVKELVINPGHGISLQSHNHRTEIWKILRGNGIVVNGDNAHEVSPQENTFHIIPNNTKHRIQNVGDDKLVLYEIAYGDPDESDVTRYDEVLI